MKFRYDLNFYLKNKLTCFLFLKQKLYCELTYFKLYFTDVEFVLKYFKLKKGEAESSDVDLEEPEHA